MVASDKDLSPVEDILFRTFVWFRVSCFNFCCWVLVFLLILWCCCRAPVSGDLHGRTWCMAGSGKATVTIATGYELDHSFHVNGKRVDTRGTPYLLRSKQSDRERMSEERTTMAQQTVMPQAVQDMIAALWQLQLQADDVREERRDRERLLKEKRKQSEQEEALAAQREWEDQDRVERRERGQEK